MIINLATMARDVLQPPYIFGSDAQIRAKQILSMLAEPSDLYDALPDKTKACDHCAGEGELQCGECGHQLDCRVCGGSGKVPVQFDESEWLDLAHLIKHLEKLRADAVSLGIMAA